MMLTTMSHAYDFEVDGIYYNILSIDDKTAEVTYNSTTNYRQRTVVIPTTVTWNGYTFSVTTIGSCAFDRFNYPHNVDTVIISKGVQVIKSLAFQSAGLKVLKMPNTISDIEDNVFSGIYGVHVTDWYVDDYDWLYSSGLFSPIYCKEYICK